MDPDPVLRTVAIEVGTLPLRGWVEDEQGQRVPFSGFLELIALLEDARDAHADAP